MKKTIYLLMLCFALVFTLASCIEQDTPSGEQNPPAHTHAFGEWETTKISTCFEQGEKTRYCSCGEKQRDAIAQTEHTFTHDFDSNCNVCKFQREIPCGHFETITQSAKEATCTENGLTEGLVCKKCEMVIQEQNVIFSPGHTEVIDEAIEPTCTTAGKTKGIHCSKCPEIILPQSYVKSLGHSAGRWIVEKEPTISEEGYQYQECARCYEKIAEESIPTISAHGLLYQVNSDNESCTITGIGDFSGANMIIPANIDGYKVTSIGENAFKKCNGLQNVVIPDGVTKINNYAFTNCENLKSVEIPASISFIGSFAFNGCKALKSFVIPDGIKTIYQFTFAGCYALENLYVPKSVTTFQQYATSAIDGLTVYYEGSESDWLKINVWSDGNHGFDSATYLYNYTVDLAYEVNSDGTSCTITGIGDFRGTNMIIPKYIDGYKVTAIGFMAFTDCRNLQKVVIPYGVTEISSYAFIRCENLESVEIPTSVSLIGYYAFDSCSALKSVVIPYGIKTIYEYSFWGCNIEKFYIPKSVKLIQDYAVSGSEDLIIYYEGSESDWLKIEKRNMTTSFYCATYVYNYTPGE